MCQMRRHVRHHQITRIPPDWRRRSQVTSGTPRCRAVAAMMRSGMSGTSLPGMVPRASATCDIRFLPSKNLDRHPQQSSRGPPSLRSAALPETRAPEPEGRRPSWRLAFWSKKNRGPQRRGSARRPLVVAGQDRQRGDPSPAKFRNFRRGPPSQRLCGEAAFHPARLLCRE